MTQALETRPRRNKPLGVGVRTAKASFAPFGAHSRAATLTQGSEGVKKSSVMLSEAKHLHLSL